MFTFNLTEQQADIVLNALAHRPYIEVQGIIVELQLQVQQQLQERRQPKTGLGAAADVHTTGYIQQQSAGGERKLVPDVVERRLDDALPRAADEVPQAINGAAHS